MSTVKKNNLMGTVGTMSNPDNVLKILETLVGKEIDIDFVNEKAKEEEHRVYLKEDGDIITNPRYFATAKYMLCYTGYESEKDGEKVYISMTRNNIGYGGGFAGTLETIKEKTSKMLEDKLMKRAAKEKGVMVYDDTSTKEEKVVKSESGETFEKRLNVLEQSLHDEIFELLMYKEKFGEYKSKNGESRIIAYLGTMGKKIALMIANGTKGEFILNERIDKVLFNCGLTDKYGNDIYIKANIIRVRGNVSLTNMQVANSKSELIGDGFEEGKIRNMTEPFRMYTNMEELNFRMRIEDFDLENRKRITHVVEDRIDRFPEKYRDAAQDLVYERIVRAVENCIKMQDRGYKFIQPMYHIKSDSIQYLLPLHLDNKLNERPELVMIVGKENGFLNVNTVIPFEEAYDNARVVEYPNCIWMSSEVK